MPDYVIYKSEFAVRAENEQLQREIAALKRDNNRLRAICGEPTLEQAPLAIALPGQNGETFQAGNCKVSIGPAPNAAPPAMNPVVAAARAKRNVAASGGNRQPADLPMSTQPRDLEVVESQQQQVGAKNVDSDATSRRFSQMELD